MLVLRDSNSIPNPLEKGAVLKRSCTAGPGLSTSSQLILVTSGDTMIAKSIIPAAAKYDITLLRAKLQFDASLPSMAMEFRVGPATRLYLPLGSPPVSPAAGKAVPIKK
jgi:hypothetical protein